MSALSPRLVAGFCAALIVLAGAGPALADREAGVKAMGSGDYAAAMTELRPLAEAGDAESQFDVGAMYDNGLGVGQDAVEASRWYMRAARQGDQTAMYNLAVMYEDGVGVGKDLVLAYAYYALAVELGPPYAARNRDKVKTLLSPDELARGEQFVRDFKPQAEQRP